MISNVFILLTLALTLVLAPGAQAAFKRFSNNVAASCINQDIAFPAATSMAVSSCDTIAGGPFTVGWSDPAITDVANYDDSLCGSTGMMTVKDASCNVLYQAVEICLTDTSSIGFTALLSCNDDIVTGTWGLPDNIK
jgi:hypothetical protein